MEYVYEVIEEITKQYPPDRVDKRFVEPDKLYNEKNASVPVGWHLHYGNMVVSVQCGEYNYADYYRPVYSYSRFETSHPYTLTAEIAVFHRTIREYWVNTEEGLGVWAWAATDKIREICEVMFYYAGRSVQTQEQP